MRSQRHYVRVAIGAGLALLLGLGIWYWRSTHFDFTVQGAYCIAPCGLDASLSPGIHKVKKKTFESLIKTAHWLAMGNSLPPHTNDWSHFYAPGAKGQIGPWECVSDSTRQRFRLHCYGTVHGLWPAGFALRRLDAKTGRTETAGTFLFPPNQHYFDETLLFVLPEPQRLEPTETAEPPEGQYSVDVAGVGFVRVRNPQGKPLEPGIHILSEEELVRIAASKDYQRLPEMAVTARLFFDQLIIAPGAHAHFEDKNGSERMTNAFNVFAFHTEGTVNGGWPSAVLLYVRTPGKPDLIDIVRLPTGRLQANILVTAIFSDKDSEARD